MSTETLHALGCSQVEAFRRDGFVVVQDLLTPDEIGRLAERADTIAAGDSTQIPEARVQLERKFREGDQAYNDQMLAVRKMFQLAHDDEVMRAHALNTNVVDVIADLLGSDDLKLYNDQFFMKPARHGTAQAWHQDSQSWSNMYPMDLVTAWTAIDDATIANGCLWMAPGTHRWGMIPRDMSPQLEARFEDDWPVVPVELASGSVSFHHSLVFHSSRANTTDTRRRGYATHYMRAQTWKDPNVTRHVEQRPFIQVRGRSFEGCV